MDDDREPCATAALRKASPMWGLPEADLLGVDNGHHFHHGWHIGWVWGTDAERGTFLDVLSEHRHPGMSAARFFADGSIEHIDLPTTMRLVGKTPAEDARLEREFIEHNRRSYEDLRQRGLLPPRGANLTSQEINEYLTSGADVRAASSE
jgi:hypothetical protein